jgi:hypothetical protein
MKILFILQNAYRSEKYDFKNDEEWQRDLKRSHTGRRLLEMVPEQAEIIVINASPKIGDQVDACFEADINYIRNKIALHQPDCICACGKVAQAGLEKLSIPFVPAPHPAYRALSKQTTNGIRNLLQALTVLKEAGIIYT